MCIYVRAWFLSCPYTHWSAHLWAILASSSLHFSLYILEAGGWGGPSYPFSGSFAHDWVEISLTTFLLKTEAAHQTYLRLLAFRHLPSVVVVHVQNQIFGCLVRNSSRFQAIAQYIAFLFVYPAILTHGVFCPWFIVLTVLSFVLGAIVSPRGVTEGRALSGGGLKAWTFITWVAAWITRGDV